MGRIKFFGKAGNEKTKQANDTDSVKNQEAEKVEIMEEETEQEVEIKQEEEIKQEVEENDNQALNVEVESKEISDAEADELQNEIAALQKQLVELQDKYLRLAAEYDNYRKRTVREKADMIQTAGETLLKNILPVVDDFERGLEQANNTDDMDAVKTGLKLIYNKLKDFLTNNGVKEIDAMNEPFDMDWHDAVTNIPAPSDDMKGIIVDVIQKGYTLNNKVIRYPKVVVGE